MKIYLERKNVFIYNFEKFLNKENKILYTNSKIIPNHIFKFGFDKPLTKIYNDLKFISFDCYKYVDLIKNNSVNTIYNIKRIKEKIEDFTLNNIDSDENLIDIYKSCNYDFSKLIKHFNEQFLISFDSSNIDFFFNSSFFNKEDSFLIVNNYDWNFSTFKDYFKLTDDYKEDNCVKPYFVRLFKYDDFNFDDIENDIKYNWMVKSYDEKNDTIID